MTIRIDQLGIPVKLRNIYQLKLRLQYLAWIRKQVACFHLSRYHWDFRDPTILEYSRIWK